MLAKAMTMLVTDKASAEEVLKGGGIDSIVSALVAKTEYEEFSENALELLNKLGKCGIDLSSVVVKGGVEAIIKITKQHNENAKIQE